MRHLRLFESKKYDNVEIDQEEFLRLYRTSIPFTKSELEKIFDYFYNYESDRMFYSNQPNIGFEWTRKFDFGDKKLYRPIFRVEGLKHPMKSGLSRWESVFKLEDHWFLVFDYIGTRSVKYRKCDDLGGLFEYFDVALKDYRIDFGDGKEYTFSADIMVRGKISKCVIQKSDDEWFYVAFSKNNINSYRDADHYKCDQFEGVMRLLRDRGILDS